MNNNLPFTIHPAYLYRECFCNTFVQTRHIQSKLLLTYTNISYDVDLPTECPQHSKLNGGLIVRNGIKPTLYKKQSVCQSNISKLSF